jgi:hypothetical protein
VQLFGSGHKVDPQHQPVVSKFGDVGERESSLSRTRFDMPCDSDYSSVAQDGITLRGDVHHPDITLVARDPSEVPLHRGTRFEFAAGWASWPLSSSA